MFSRVRYFFSDLGHWVRLHLPGLPHLRRPGRRTAIAAGAVLLIAVLAGAGYLLYDKLNDEEEPPPAAAPPAVIREVHSSDEDTGDLGFPAFATKNTTRIAGADVVADAAAVALATHPSTGGLEGPAAVSLVDAGDWPSAVAASSLTAAPVGAPLLFTEGGEVPELTASALRALAPKGSADTDDKQAFRIGDAAGVAGLRTEDVKGGSPAEVAAAIDELRGKLTGQPDAVIVAGADEPAFAMPAAGWAGRSGDPVLFTLRKTVPDATLDALKSHKDVPVYVLGPESAVAKEAFEKIDDAAGSVTRIAGEDPVENAVEFARYSDDGFGWNMNDPGHGFVLASADRPADAGAAAPLSASGTWGPLVLTDDQ